MEETLSSGVFDAFIACEEKKKNLNQSGYLWVFSWLIYKANMLKPNIITEEDEKDGKTKDLIKSTWEILIRPSAEEKDR